jgi:hypothetical protein
MKKLAFIFCLSSLFAMSANGQNFQQPLEKVFNYLMPGHGVRHHAVMKSYSDSLLTSYNVWNKSNGVTSNMYFELKKDGTFALVEVDYTYVKDGKVLESGVLDDSGDTLEKTVYVYMSSNNSEIHYTYEFDGADPVLVTEEHYYGVKNLEISGLDAVNDIMGLSSVVCDSLIIYEYYEEEDTSVMSGYFTFDSDGVPASFSMSMEYSGMLMDVIVRFTAANKLPVKAVVSISAMGGMMTANIMEVAVSYNNDGQVLESEMLPIKNDLFDVSSMLPRSKSIFAYQNKKLHCASNYGWVVYDSTHADYELESRDYYTYKVTTGDIDTVYHYEQYSQLAGIAAAAKLQVTLSPNPVSDMLFVRGLEQPAEVVVYSAEGKKVLSGVVGAGEGTLSLNQLANGMYFVVLRNEAGVAVKQVVKR